MLENDLSLLQDAARAAAAIALRHFDGARLAIEKPGGQGPVTAADLEIDRMLRAELTAARPEYGWLSEESEDDAVRLGARRVFIVDPIDGTRAFVEGGKAWSNVIAVAEQGRVIAAVVMLPRLDRMYSAVLGQGAFCNGRPIQVSRRSGLDGARVLLNRTQLAAKYWRQDMPAFELHFRSSLAYRMCLTAEGKFDAMLTFRDAWEWDIAAGDLIAREAGATVTDRTGAAPVFNNPLPQVAGVIAAGPVLHAEILANSASAISEDRR